VPSGVSEERYVDRLAPVAFENTNQAPPTDIHGHGYCKPTRNNPPPLLTVLSGRYSVRFNPGTGMENRRVLSVSGVEVSIPTDSQRSRQLLTLDQRAVRSFSLPSLNSD
jgi:hypothetical protein